MARAAGQVDFLLAGLTDNNGDMLAGGKVYTYGAGTTSDQPVYTDVQATTQATNPVILDVYGRASVFGIGNYKFIIKNSDDATIATLDNLYYGSSDSGTVSWGGTSTGSSNTYVVTTNPVQSSFSVGDEVKWVANHTSSGAATLNPNGVGAQSIKNTDGSAIGSGDIASDTIYQTVWDGTNWVLTNHQTVNGAEITAASVGAAQMTNDSIGEPAILFANNTNLHWNDSGGSALDILKVDSSDNTVLNAKTGKEIDLKIAGSTKWSIDASGHYLPAADDTYNIGSATVAALAVYANTVSASSGHNLVVNAPTGKDIDFQIAGTSKWFVDSSASANLVPQGSDARSIGGTSNLLWACFANRLYGASGGSLNLGIGTTTHWTLDSSGNLDPAADGTLTLGSRSAAVKRVGMAVQSWTPTLTAWASGGGSSVLSTSSILAQWVDHGHHIIFMLSFTTTTIAASTSFITVTFPSDLSGRSGTGGKAIGTLDLDGVFSTIEMNSSGVANLAIRQQDQTAFDMTNPTRINITGSFSID